MLISWITIMPAINEMPDTLNMSEMMDYILNEMSSNDLSSPIAVASFASTIMYCIFLAAPIFRRTNDIYDNTKKAKTYSIIFVLGQLLGSPYVGTLMGSFYSTIELFCLILSIASMFVLLMCILKKSR